MNADVAKYITKDNGGTLKLYLQSFSVVDSSCAYNSLTPNPKPIYIKIVINSFGQPTMYPTYIPTVSPSSNSETSVTKIEQNVAFISISPTALSIIAVLIVQLVAFIGVYFARLRKNTNVVRMTSVRGMTVMGLLAGEWVTTVVSVIKLYNTKDYEIWGLLLVLARGIEMIISAFVLIFVFGPKTIKSMTNLSKLIDNKHMAEKSRYYAFISIFVLVNTSAIVMLPWKDSEFARITRGFPNINSLRLTRFINIVITILCIAFLIPYLNHEKGVSFTNIFLYFNVVFHILQLAIYTLEYFLMSSSIEDCKTSLQDAEDKEKDKVKRDKKGSINSILSATESMRPSEIELGNIQLDFSNLNENDIENGDDGDGDAKNPLHTAIAIAKSIAINKQQQIEIDLLKEQLAEREKRDAETNAILKQLLQNSNHDVKNENQEIVTDNLVLTASKAESKEEI
jgi:hypothetical protein